MANLTRARALERLVYDPVTGSLKWRDGKCKGLEAGQKSKDYAQVCLDGVLYLVHRVIWLMVTGEWPTTSIDHKNRKHWDNRWDNLRLADQVTQTQNRDKPWGVSGLLGAVAHGRGFRSQIMVRGVIHRLGSFSTPEEASAAYMAAKAIHHPGYNVSLS